MSRKVYPGNIKLAHQQLKLADEIRERAYEFDPTLRPKETPRMATDSAMAFDSEAIINKALRKAGLEMSRYTFATNRRRHAHDEESRDLDGAYKHLYKAMDHLADSRDGKIDFDQDVFNKHVGDACDCLKAGAKDELEEPVKEVGGSGRGARDSLPRGVRRSGAFDADALFQRGNGD